MVLMWAVLAFAVPQDLAEILRRWSDDDPAARDAASDELIRRWKEWKDADFRTLDLAARGTDAETTARARAALEKLRFLREYGPEVFPKIERAAAIVAEIRSVPEAERRMHMIDSDEKSFRQRLLDLGPDIEPYLRTCLAEETVLSEVASVLGQIGTEATLPALLERFPEPDAKLTPEHQYRCSTLTIALWRLTRVPIGFGGGRSEPYSPALAAQWRAWHALWKDALWATPGHVRVDAEAWTAGRTVREYRKDHPRIPLGEILEWKEGAEYEARLRSACVTRIFDSLGVPGAWVPPAIQILGEIDDPRAFEALKKLSREPDLDAFVRNRIALSLREKGAAGLPEIERLWAQEEDRFLAGPRARARLDAKLARPLLSPRVDDEAAKLLLACLENPAKASALAGLLETPDPDPATLEIAGFVADPTVRARLASIAAHPKTDPVVRIEAHVALARQGGAPDPLAAALGDASPFVRLAAAEGLWKLGKRDGTKTLIGLLELSPLEFGLPLPDRPTLMPPARKSGLHVVRRACELLGDMGDASALPGLRALEAANLNGSLGLKSDDRGYGWYGRPDIVARAKLGDGSGVELLLASLRESGDPLGVVGDDGRRGDLEEIGLKRYARELVPLLRAGPYEGPTRPLYAARAILSLLARGK